jgi:hypothetical protein
MVASFRQMVPHEVYAHETRDAKKMFSRQDAKIAKKSLKDVVLKSSFL